MNRLVGPRLTVWTALLAAVLLTLPMSSSAWGKPTLGTDFSIGTNFTDSTRGNPSFFIPPDTMGAVGPNEIAVMINGAFVVYDKSGTQLQSQSLNSFWTAAGATPAGSYAFDPRVLYDPNDGRWFAVSVDNAGGANNFLVAVSNNTNPQTGGGAGWTGFQIDADTDNVEWADFPMLGMNDDFVVVSANMFPISSGSASTSFLVLPKNDLEGGSIANATLIENVNVNNTGYSAQPIVDLDNGSGKLPILSSYNKPVGGWLARQNVNTPINSPTLDGTPAFIGVTARSLPGDVDQPGTKTDIDAGDNRFSGNAVLQNGSIWGAHSVEYNGLAAIEWYEIRESDNALLQSGLITAADMPTTAPDPDMEFNYPSISVNDGGDVVIGFSGGSPTQFMSTYVAVGETIAGVTTFSDVILTMAGLSDYQRLDTVGRNRWGDYSATVLDPSDPTGNTFWTFQEFVNSTDQWGIQVTQINLSATVAIPEPSTLVALLGMVATGLMIGLRRRMKRS